MSRSPFPLPALLRWWGLLAVSLLCAAAGAQGPMSEPRVALQGFDPVAYFTESRPVRGSPEFQRDFDGTRYHFASARNRDLFSADPDRYAPQFSGYCSASVGNGRKNEGDPQVWKIVGGKLYVFGKAGPWVDDPAALARSHAAWSSLK